MGDIDQQMLRIMREHPGLPIAEYEVLRRSENLAAEAEYTRQAIAFEKRKAKEKQEKALKKALRGIKE